MSRAAQRMQSVATHRPPTRRRRFRHDELTAVDLFSGFGGLTKGVEMAGFTAITAANHRAYKVEVHEANHPHVEHWIADLVDTESAAYHDVRDLPAADLLVAGVSCVNHSPANTKKAYAEGLTLFNMDDPDYEERVTRSERDRATANCVLHYAQKHLPRMILVECTTQLTSWGAAVPGRKKVGDGSTYRWWLKQFELLGYDHKVMYLNTQFFGVPQSRDRGFWAFWLKGIPAPDLEHRPIAWCDPCHKVVESVWTWKTGLPPTGKVAYGEQYNYRCPSCRREVIPTMAPSINALDLTNLGTRIGDKPIKDYKDKDGTVVYRGRMAESTTGRAERCLRKFPDYPAILMPAKGAHGTEKHPWQPMATQTSQQETALLSTGSVAVTGHVIAAHKHNGDGQHFSQPMDTVTSTHEKAMLFAAIDNYQGAQRGLDEPLPTQGGSETMAVVSARVMPNRTHATSRSLGEPMETLVAGAGAGGLGMLSAAGVVPFRKNTLPTSHAEPMPAVTAAQIPGLLTAAGFIKNNGSIDEAKYRAHPLSDPLGTIVGSGAHQSLLSAGWYKQNGTGVDATAPHPVTDPLGTLTSRDTTALLAAEWREALSQVTLEDCYFRMLGPHEIGRGCGFDVSFPGYGYEGSFVVWGSARDQTDGFGNAVTPAVGEWIGTRLREALHRTESVA
ncbi:DNA cytosine methyltransferase [Lentzea sp. NPDC092896]|uniref:DNA cytosine methyltransferase n=1 Tax=Lentzea sp. NPDC092896 TaxID=3364127 RepID=UPI0038062424